MIEKGALLFVSCFFEKIPESDVEVNRVITNNRNDIKTAHIFRFRN